MLDADAIDDPFGVLKNATSLLLMHHPLGWQSRRAQAEFKSAVYAPGRFAACLHGHMHTAWQDVVSGGDGVTRAYFQAPSLLGLETSLGLGDRLGLATPGHIRAVRGTCLGPILAQQSIREMERTNRTPDDVMDDATWGVLQEGWREGFGSDADHLDSHEPSDSL